jgi:putative ABC transport system permease protein
VIDGTHAEPFRPIAYVDTDDVDAFGLEGSANSAVITPVAGASAAEVGREAFVVPGVALVQPVSATAGFLDDALGQFVGFFVIAAGAVVALALLVAFNSAAIAADERRREHATLFAFGLPVRTVLGVLVAEGVIVGIAATIIGLGVGYALVGWMVNSIISSTVPEIGLAVVVTATPLVAAVVVGVAAVAVAPVLVVRRLRRMSIPDALRVME